MLRFAGCFVVEGKHIAEFFSGTGFCNSVIDDALADECGSGAGYVQNSPLV